MVTENVKIIVSSSGTVTVKKDLEGVGDAARDAGSGVDFLKGALTALISVQTFRTFADITGTLTDFKSRLDLATGSVTAGEAAMSRLFDMAEMTYSSFDQTAEVFLRNHEVLKAMGGSTQEALNFTQALNDALVVSGAKGDMAERAMSALNRAMATGKLEMTGLETIMNDSSRVADLLAKELGVNRNELMQLENRSRITGKVIYDALTKNMVTLRAEAEQMPATIGDALGRVNLAFTKLIWNMDTASGASRMLAGAIIWVADNLQLIMIALTPLMAALTILGIQIIGVTVINAFRSLTVAIGESGRALSALYSLIMRNPLVAIGVAIAAVIAWFIDWEVALQRAIELWGKLVQAIGLFTDAMGWTSGLSAKGLEIYVNAEQAAKDLIEAANKLKDSMTGAGSSLGNGVKAGSAAGANMMKNGIEAGAANASKQLIAKYEELNGKVIKPLGDTLIEGGEYIHNQVTGAVTKASGDMKGSIEEGGNTAGKTMEGALDSGGQKAGGHIYNSMESAFATLADLLTVFTRFIQRERMELAKIQAETVKLYAEAAKTEAEAAAIRSGRGSGGSGGSGAGAAARSGGSSGLVGGRWNDPFYKGEPATGGETTPEVSTSITNVLDPTGMIDTLDTDAGHNAIVNVIKYNREELRAILGSV